MSDTPVSPSEHQATPSLPPIPRPTPARDTLVVLAFGLALAATCLLVSAGEGEKAGHRPWGKNVILRSIIELLNFNYQYPTPRGAGVKFLAQAVGAAGLLLSAAALWYVRSRRPDDWLGEESAPAPPIARGWSERISPAGGAQIALILFGTWMALSAWWSPWPAAALGEAVRNGFLIVVAVSLGRSLSRRGARTACVVLVVVLLATSVLGLWYTAVRNPELRLEYPIGNPIFFAACMIPGLLLSAGLFNGWLEQAAARRRSRAAEGEPSGGRGRAMAVAVGCALAFLVIGWAFYLARSRGPEVALLVGAGVMVVLLLVEWLPRQHRRLALLAVFGLGLAAALFVGRIYVNSQLGIQEGGRGATVRVRMYTWSYAIDLFARRPLGGHGQGGYFLLAQGMSRGLDGRLRGTAERDPAAFPSELLGHAHNEWLEILADLGAAGLALMLLCLGLTFWIGLRGLEQLKDPRDRWCMLALLAALVALVVEESADVAMRMPVFPFIFYSVLGLVWAFGSQEQEAKPPVWHTPFVRGGGIALAVLAALAIVIAAGRDWQGALADQRMGAFAEKQKWDDALHEGERAMSWRLILEDRFSAAYQVTGVAHEAAVSRVQQLGSMLERAQSADDNIRQLAFEDMVMFNSYGERCVETGRTLLESIPGVDQVAAWLSNVYLMHAQVQEYRRALGMPAADQNQMQAIFENAYGWLNAEYARDRLNAEVALRLFVVSEGRPLAERVDMLRTALRGGPEPMEALAQIENGLSHLREDPGFEAYLSKLLDVAQEALTVPDPEQWSDWYAPESFRLAALRDLGTANFESAVESMEQATRLCELPRMTQSFPTLASVVRLEQARYLLWARPQEPGSAVEAAKRAIELWPRVGQRDEQLRPVRQELSLYQLAAGDEAGATQTLRVIRPGAVDDQVRRFLGYGYVELCRRFLEIAPDRRPPQFSSWLERSFELLPNSPEGRLVQAHLEVEAGRREAAMEILASIGEQLEPQGLVELLRNFLTQHPQDRALREAAAARFPEIVRLSASRPESQPESEPADEPQTRPATRSVPPGNES